jgi:hypothetical protein
MNNNNGCDVNLEDIEEMSLTPAQVEFKTKNEEKKNPDDTMKDILGCWSKSVKECDNDIFCWTCPDHAEVSKQHRSWKSFQEH